MCMDSGGMKIFRDILFCIFAGWTAIWAQEKSPGDSLQSCIEIHAPRSGLNVWVNGEWIGKTPVPPVRIPAAACRVRVQHPDSANWMSRDWIRNVHLRPGECRELRVELDNSFWIGSDPSPTHMNA